MQLTKIYDKRWNVLRDIVHIRAYFSIVLYVSDESQGQDDLKLIDYYRLKKRTNK